MRTALRLCLLVALVLGSFGLARPTPAQAASYPACAPGSQQLTGASAGGALWVLCVPLTNWNGDLVLYAHGYEAPGPYLPPNSLPPTFANLTLPDNTYLPDLIESLHYAFGATTYRRSGLVAADGAQDLAAVAVAARQALGTSLHRIYATGVSEGGLVTALAVEQRPDLFAGGLSTCGPIGDFRQQINYFGDFRVLFDYFFPHTLPPSPISIPQSLILNWTPAGAMAAVLGALQNNPSAAAQLISTAKAAIDPADPTTVGRTTLDVLGYNVNATNDAVYWLGGNPYGNRFRWYSGSANDFALNLGVKRFDASSTALAHLAPYQTSGKLSRPLVTLHTTGDDVIPYWQELLYAAKVIAKGSAGYLTPIPIFRYGHCNFQSSEVLAAFGILVLQTTGSQPAGLQKQFNLDQVRRDNERARQMISVPAEDGRP